MGGVTEWKHVASMASARGLEMAPHGSSMLHVHLVAAVSNGMIVEHVISEGETGAIFDYDIKMDADGMISPPQKPGIGFEVNEEVVKKYLVK